MSHRTTLAALGLSAALLAAAPADDPPARGELTVIDAKGKEHKVRSWKFVAGTRRLSWLAPAEADRTGPGDDKRPERDGRRPGRAPAPERGPEALAFRDDNSTGFLDGVLTLIAVEHVRAVEYDADKQTVTVRVAAGDKPESDIEVTGTTRFRESNKLSVEAEVDKGDLGVAAVKFHGGVKANGVRGFRLAAPNPAPAPKGRPATVTVADEGKKTAVKVADLQALYRAGGGELLSPTLMFKKTVKVDVAKLEKLAPSEEAKGDWAVTLKDGTAETLTLITEGELNGKPVELQGFLARVPEGYKLFPPHTVAEVVFDGAAGGDKSGEDK
jgi:hypothetical protein